MTRSELKDKLDKMNVPEYLYSLYDELWSGRVIIYHNYFKWEVFYLGERGDRNELGVFFSEDEACQYVLNHFIEAQDRARQYGYKGYGV